jgi:hypothetical protein
MFFYRKENNLKLSTGVWPHFTKKIALDVFIRLECGLIWVGLVWFGLVWLG